MRSTLTCTNWGDDHLEEVREVVGDTLGEDAEELIVALRESHVHELNEEGHLEEIEEGCASLTACHHSNT
jgi:hypothetical protein